MSDNEKKQPADATATPAPSDAAKVTEHITSLSAPASGLSIIGVPGGNIPESEFASLPISVKELIAAGWTPNYSRGGNS